MRKLLILTALVAGLALPAAGTAKPTNPGGDSTVGQGGGGNCLPYNGGSLCCPTPWTLYTHYAYAGYVWFCDPEGWR